MRGSPETGWLSVLLVIILSVQPASPQEVGPPETPAPAAIPHPTPQPPIHRRKVITARAIPHPLPSLGLTTPGPEVTPLYAPRTSIRPAFTPAPIPNRDADAPPAPRASTEPNLSPGLFVRRDSYRGDAYTPHSTAQSDQDRRAHPAAGFNFHMPFTPP